MTRPISNNPLSNVAMRTGPDIFDRLWRLERRPWCCNRAPYHPTRTRSLTMRRSASAPPFQGHFCQPVSPLYFRQMFPNDLPYAALQKRSRKIRSNIKCNKQKIAVKRDDTDLCVGRFLVGNFARGNRMVCFRELSRDKIA